MMISALSLFFSILGFVAPFASIVLYKTSHYGWIIVCYAIIVLNDLLVIGFGDYVSSTNMVKKIKSPTRWVICTIFTIGTFIRMEKTLFNFFVSLSFVCCFYEAFLYIILFIISIPMLLAKLIGLIKKKKSNVKKNSLSFENEGDIAPIRKNAVTARDLKLEDSKPEQEDIASEKDKRVTLTKKDFGKGILSYIVMLHGDSFEERLKELEMEWDFVKYLTYIQYVVYISEKILETRFSTADSCEIAVSSFDGIVGYLDVVDDDKKGAMAEVMKEQYLSFKEDINYGIYSEAELHSLVNSFMEDIDVGKSFFCHSTFFLDFSSYIIHHTSSILDENIQIY